jgi:hypothetical protein
MLPEKQTGCQTPVVLPCLAAAAGLCYNRGRTLVR